MDYTIFAGVSLYAVPVLILLVLCTGLAKNVNVYETFVEGASEGVTTIARILPSLVGLMTAVGVFRASGALDIIVRIAGPVASFLGIPAEAMPLALMRPISGSASLALVSDIINLHGPDSYVGRVVCTMMGSTETIFYTLAVYYGSAGIRKARYTLAAALLADGAGIVASAWICAAVFGRS